MIKSIIQRLD